MLVPGAQRSSARSDENMREIAFDNAPCGLFVCDIEGWFTAVNPSFERLSGYTAEELIGVMRLGDLLDPAQFAARGDRLLPEAERPPRPVQPSMGAEGPEGDFEWICVRRDQSRLDVLLSVAPILDYHGRVEAHTGWMADNSRRAWQQNQLWYRAHHDTLTGLPNQALLLEQLDLALQRRRRDGEPVRLLIMEIDNLRAVHDSLGQGAADAMLRTVAARLRLQQVRGEHLATLDSGQFALVSVGENRLSPQREADLFTLVCGPVPYALTTVRPSASIGVASFPDAGDDAASLLHRARLALSTARLDGGGTARHFEFDMQSSSSQRHTLELMLRRAVEDEALSLAFQPQVNLATGRVKLAETLLRWNHAERGAISPAQFVPIAEATGLILPIGEWVIRQACRQAARILARYGECPRIAVNVSPVQFRRQDVLAIVRRELESARLDPKYLEVEITEGVLLNDTEQAIATLNGLRELGVEIAIDDFGTGYSSLSYLTRFKVDRIKIDRSLVVAMMVSNHGMAIVSAILAMAHALDVRVTAEGVETQEQADVLREMGCDEIQGYWFSRPLAPIAFEQALAPWGEPTS